MRVAHVALAALVAALAAAGTWLLGAQEASAVRRVFLQLSPTHVLELAVLLVIAGAAISLPPTDRLVSAPVARGRAAARRALAVIAAVPPIVALTAIVGAAAAFRVALGAAETIPRVLGDELVYVDLAKSFALHGKPLLRGGLDIGQSLLYPLFLSPAYALAADGAAAFAAAKAMNAVAMALTAVPAYYLARRILSRGWSLGVSALAVAVPWTAYAALSMTEPLFYPLFTAFALAFVQMLERPTTRRQLAVLLALTVLVGVRAQALALVGSVVAAIVVSGLLDGALRRALRTYLVTLVALGVALTAGLSVAAAGLPVPTGGYKGLFNLRYGVLGVAKWTVWNLATYELAVGVFALLAFPLALLRLLRSGAPAAERAFGLAAVTLFAGILASVAALSASPFGLGILHERNLFYVTPLVVACLAYWLANGLPRPRGVATAVVLAAVGVAASVPERILLTTNNVDGPTASFLRGFKELAPGVPAQLWLVAAAVVAGVSFLVVRRPFFPVAAVVLAFAALTAATDYQGPLSPSQDRALAWVDHALPGGATATIVHMGFPRPSLPCAESAEYAQQGLVVWTEFFNARVDRVVHVYGKVGRDFLDSPELAVGPGGLLLDGGRPLRAGYVVVDTRQPIVGTRLARFDLSTIGTGSQDGASLSLWRVTPPLRLAPRPTALPPRADGRSC